jgi:hypothetical protein
MTISTEQFTTINTGTTANDGSGDSLRTAFTKVNNNFAAIGDTGFNAANIVSTGTIQATTFIGDGSQLTGLVLAPAVTAVTVTANAQANITSVGTLTSLTVTGNIVAGNVAGTNLTGHIATAAQSQITSVGTLTSLTVSGNVGSGNATITNNLTVSNVSITGQLTTTNPFIYKYSNEAATNTSVRTMNLSSTGDGVVLLQINSNLAITYSATITPGRKSELTVLNLSGAGHYVNLPNANTNKSSGNILVANGSGAQFIFTTFGTTAAEVVVAVLNS